MPRWPSLALSPVVLFVAASVCSAEEIVIARGPAPTIDAALEETPESIAGFVFPVAGPHHFISSFGFCRDGCRRAHQGNDLFAARGTPVVGLPDRDTTVCGRAPCSADSWPWECSRCWSVSVWLAERRPAARPAAIW